METKFRIVETEEYTLAVSNKEVKEGEYGLADIIASDFYGVVIYNGAFAKHYFKKIIGYKPKGNASELDVPLLPDVEDDVEKLAKKYINDTLRDEESDDYFLGRMEGFKDGHKAATKVYSEEDIDNAYIQ